jgi:hypothetical protein
LYFIYRPFGALSLIAVSINISFLWDLGNIIFPAFLKGKIKCLFQDSSISL